MIFRQFSKIRGGLGKRGESGPSSPEVNLGVEGGIWGVSSWGQGVKVLVLLMIALARDEGIFGGFLGIAQQTCMWRLVVDSMILATFNIGLKN